MKRILTVEEMSGADAAAIGFGIPSLVLMERAALSVVEEILDRGYDTSSVLVLIGSGNNGGDGAAIARLLAEKNISSEMMLFGDPEKRSEQLKVQLRICEHYGVKCTAEYIPGKYSLIVDAVFGIGLSREIGGRISEIIDAVNSDSVPLVAVDIASGIEGSTGRILGNALRAELTVTFAAGKIGHYLYPGAEFSGEVVVKKIGIPIGEKTGTVIWHIEENDLGLLPKRDESGNKSTFGKLLVIAGSSSICGAAYLCAAAALRSGVGMVRIFTEESNRAALNVLLPEALIDTYADGWFSSEKLKKALEWADGVVIGPGLDTTRTSRELFKAFISMNTLPVLYDADALNIIASEGYDIKSFNTPAVVTPHIGEMSRLTAGSVKEIKADPVNTALNYACRTGAVCVLKDARTVTAYPDGRVFINTSGCSALSTAGSGDVLAGAAGAYMLRFSETSLPIEAMAVYVHGLLGEMAAQKYGKSAVKAGDLIETLKEIKY